jgi:hypothetical protein
MLMVELWREGKGQISLVISSEETPSHWNLIIKKTKQILIRNIYIYGIVMRYISFLSLIKKKKNENLVFLPLWVLTPDFLLSRKPTLPQPLGWTASGSFLYLVTLIRQNYSRMVLTIWRLVLLCLFKSRRAHLNSQSPQSASK